MSLSLDIKKVADSLQKNAHTSRIQGVFLATYVFYGSSSGKVQLCQVPLF